MKPAGRAGGEVGTRIATRKGGGRNASWGASALPATYRGAGVASGAGVVPPLTQLWYTILVVLVYRDQGRELPTVRNRGSDRERERRRAETEGYGECNAETEEEECSLRRPSF